MKMGIQLQHTNSSPALLASRQSIFSSSSSSDGGGGGSGGINGGDDGPTTPEDLKELLSDRYYATQIPCRHYDEIFPGMFLGDMKTAKNCLTLEKLGITHILNAAYTPSPFTDRETSDAYYRERNFPCEFWGIPAMDFPSYKISQWFEKSTEFIHEALRNKGRVLVHCQVGVSRSATLVIAYLMIKHKMPAMDAVQLVGSRRPIYPNDGFLKQICELDYRLAHPRSAFIRSLSLMSRRTLNVLFRSNSSSSSSSSSASKTKAKASDDLRRQSHNNNEKRRSSISIFGNGGSSSGTSGSNSKSKTEQPSR